MIYCTRLLPAAKRRPRSFRETYPISSMPPGYYDFDAVGFLLVRTNRSVATLGSTGNLRGMVALTIHLPESLAKAFGANAETQSRRLLEDAAVEEYRLGSLSQRQVGELLGIDYWQTEEFLAARKVPLNYSIADLESDRETLDAILLRG